VIRGRSGRPCNLLRINQSARPLPSLAGKSLFAPFTGSVLLIIQLSALPTRGSTPAAPFSGLRAGPLPGPLTLGRLVEALPESAYHPFL